MADSLCLTPACLQVASNLIWQMAPNWEKMDPCTDLDKMVCHNFKDTHEPNRDILSIIQLHNNRIIKSIIESNYAEAADYKVIPGKSNFTRNSVDEANFQQLQHAYETCMDIEAISKAGTKPLVELISALNSIWPLTTDLKAKLTPADYDGLSKASFFLQELGISGFAQFAVAPNYYDPGTQTVYVGQTELVQQQNASTYEDPEAMKIYAKDIATVFSTSLFPADLPVTAAATLAEGIVNLEVDIASVQIPGVKDDANAKNVTLKQLGEIAPALGLDKVLRNLLPPSYPEDKTLLLDPAQFFPNLTSIVASYPKAVIQSYLMHKIWASFAKALITHGSPDITTDQRRELCFMHLDNALRFVIGRFFAAATYPDAAREFSSKLATDLRSQFKERIDTLEWMSPEAKVRAKKKVDNMEQNIGYPTSNPDIRSPESIASYYQGLNITDNYFANVLSVRKFSTNKPFTSVLKPTDRTDMGEKIQEANAGYHPVYNSINIYAGISQLPLFSEALPGYVSYGALGSIIGHEISHGFDDNGSQYNENGEHESWWDNKTVSAFQERTQCFVKQYDAYTYPIPGGRMNTNGTTTLGENLSDAGGLRIAYDAWKKTQTKTDAKKDLGLPGLEKFSPEELFFLFYANTWCQSLTPENNLETWPTEEHAYHSHRIMGAAANSGAFKEIFKCKVQEPECELFN